MPVYPGALGVRGFSFLFAQQVLFVAAILVQHTYYVIVAKLRSQSKSRHAIVVLGLDISFVGQKHFRHFLVAL
jgi:hypothetical protein